MSEAPRQIHRPATIKEEPVIEVIEGTTTSAYRRCNRCKKPWKHGSIHHCTEKFKCTACPLERYKCKLCSYRGILLVNYYRHVQRFHNDKNGPLFSNVQNQFKLYFCELCTFKTYSQLMYISHIRRCVHHKPAKAEVKPKSQFQWFRCIHCPFKSKTFTALQYHERNDECRYVPLTDGVFQCKLCLYKSKILQAFRNHVELTHMLKGRFKCDWCDFRAEKVDELTEHMATHIQTPQVEKFKCELCTFQTGEENGLKLHVMMNHIAPTNMKQRKCKICKHQEKSIMYRRKGKVCRCVPDD